MNEYVESKVGLPGLLLALFGVGNGLLNFAWMAYVVIMAVLQIVNDPDFLVPVLTGNAATLILQCLALVAALLQIAAGFRLRSAGSPMLVYAGAISAMLPCCSGGCCCIGLAIGAWAIASMQDDQVKAAFAEA